MMNTTRCILQLPVPRQSWWSRLWHPLTTVSLDLSEFVTGFDGKSTVTFHRLRLPLRVNDARSPTSQTNPIVTHSDGFVVKANKAPRRRRQVSKITSGPIGKDAA